MLLTLRRRISRIILHQGNSGGINVEQDGSVIIAGEILDSGCNAVKLDRNGNEQWRTSLDERGVQFGGLTFLAEGNENALFFGFDDAQGANSYIIKLDAEGHLVWKNELFPEVAGISACQDGGVIACLSELLDDGRISHHTVKLDSSGKQVFDSSFEDDIELQITLLDSCAADRFGNTYRHAVNCEQVDVYENCIIWKSIVVKYDENGSEIWVADLHNLTPTSTPSPEAIYIENPYRGFTLSPGLRPTFDNSDDDVTRDDDIMPDDDTTPDDDSSHSSGGGNSGCGC
jgi:hypothetical protein